VLDVQLIRQPICQGASDHRSPVGAIVQQQDDCVRFSGLSSEGAQAATDPRGFVPDRDGDNGPCCSCSARRLAIRMHFDNGSGRHPYQRPADALGSRSRFSSPTFDRRANPTHTLARSHVGNLLAGPSVHIAAPQARWRMRNRVPTSSLELSHSGCRRQQSISALR
jgi:hypothetical protein